ncbi:MAG TPA: PAS domain S-box protein [Rubricoccaceae bacterium]|jgi:PAS domain S-box-containing protein
MTAAGLDAPTPPHARPSRPALRILHLEDSDIDNAIVRRYLEREGFGGHIIAASTRADFLEHLSHHFDVVLADHSMPGFDSCEALRLVQQRCPGVPFIIVSGTITEEAAVESIKSGASDYIWKDRLQRLGPAIETALRERRHRTEREAALRARREIETLGHAVLASLSQLICVIGPDGVIVQTNASWKRAGAERGRDGLTGLDIGTDYLDVCRRAAARGDDSARAALAGITAVLSGEQGEFSLEYPCHGPGGKAWYTLCVTPLGSGLGAVLSHQSITDLRASQERLSQNQARLKAIFEGSLDSIFLADDAGRYVDVNPAAAALLGYTREELLRLGVRDIWPPEMQPDFDERWKVLRAQGSRTGEFMFQRKDGTAVEAEQRATFNIMPGLHLSILRDVTERKAAAAALAAASQRTAEILESIDDGFFALDADWRFTYVNERAAHYWQRESDELIGEEFWAEFPWAVGSVFEMHYRRAAETGVPEEFDAYYAPLQVHRAVRVFPFAGGLSVYFRDVTEEKRAETALRESEERLRLVGMATNDSVWDWNLHSGVVTINDTFINASGWPKPAGAGFTIDWILAHVHPEDRDRVAESLIGTVRGDGQAWLVECRIERADGTWADVLNRGYIVRGADGRATRIVGAVIDLSAQKETERALVAAKEAAEEVARAKSSLLMNMSHEIRTPLTAVIGYSEMLAGEAPPELQDLVEPIWRGGQRLLDTLNSVLDLAQIEAGALPLATVAVDLRAEADGAVAALQPLAQAKKLALTLTGTSTSARADRPALARVLTNLVGNAIKFTERGTVTVEVWSEGGRAWVRVSDTGVGIDAAFLPRVFEDFAQESTGANRRFEGSGLGLTITRGLVSKMGGEITVTSEKGVGSTFTVCLPGG